MGRSFSNATVELALAGYAGFHTTTPPTAESEYGVYWPTFVPATEVEHAVVLPDGTRRVIPPHAEPGEGHPGPALTGTRSPPPAARPATSTGPSGMTEGNGTTRENGAAGSTGAAEVSRAAEISGATEASWVTEVSWATEVSGDAEVSGAAEVGGPTRRAPLGLVCGARSGDKGGNANVGLWTPDPAAYGWLRDYLDVERFRALLPEAAELEIRRYELPNLRALNFVVVGLLGLGVAASTRPDPQAKGLGEYLRSRHVDIPTRLLPPEALPARRVHDRG